MTTGSEGALGQILLTWQVLPVLLGFGDSQVLALPLGHSSRKDGPDSLIRLHKTPKREKTLPRHTKRESGGAADARIRTLSAMTAEAQEAFSQAEDSVTLGPSPTPRRGSYRTSSPLWFSLKAIPTAPLTRTSPRHLISWQSGSSKARRAHPASPHPETPAV